MSKPIEPLGVFVLVKMDKVEEKTAGGIIIPEQTREKNQFAVMQGTCMGVGPQCDRITEAQVGKKLVFGRYVGLVHEDGDVHYRLIDQDEIRGVLTA